jgi:asparagine synthase (glutamine-hydrolysing)
MCGIAGFIEKAWSEDEARAHLGRMLDAIRHRGPDGEGTHVTDDGFAFGMRRLSIIDLAGGQQPIWNEDRTVGVVFNGEIYNYVELTRELTAGGHQFRTHTDTEVLVHLYEDCGEAMFARLRGMFAFALIDTRRRSVMLARDHFGQKPLYYFARGGRLAFASELKCLLKLPGVPRETGSEAFLDYVSWLSLPAPVTHLRHIYKLPPASFAMVQLDAPDDVKVGQYWEYSLREPPNLPNLGEAAEMLDAVLEDSVNVHLRADVPVGVLLSSGLDSRCIATYARPLCHERLSTFTVGFSDEASELHGAAETAREIGSCHHAVELSANALADGIHRIAWHLDEPIGDPAAFAVLKVCEFARQHVKVLLSGEGSDELFGGYDSRYSGMLATLRRSDKLRRFAPFLPSPDGAGIPSRWRRLGARAHQTPASEALTLRIEGLPGDVRSPRGLTPDQLRRLQKRADAISKTVYHSQRDRLSELLTLDIQWQLAESLLQKADKMSMAASIELRSPILDLRVAELAARLPSDLKLPPGGPGKLVLRHCLARRLHEPPSRPKRGFPIPLRSWFSGPLRGTLEDALFAPNAACLDHLDRKLLRSAWNDFLSGEWDGAPTLYALWLYEAWHASIVRAC